MKPIVFLTGRSFVNGVRRAVTSAKRLIGLIVILLYYAQFLFRPFQSAHAPGAGGIVSFQVEAFRTGMFLVFVLVTLAVTLSSVSPRGGFRPADVDVLFATPIDPRVVLFYRLLRDYIVALLFPILIAVLAGRSGMQSFLALFRGVPAQGSYVGKLFVLTYVLVALVCVTATFAFGLYINRNDEESDRRKARAIRTGCSRIRPSGAATRAAG